MKPGPPPEIAVDLLSDRIALWCATCGNGHDLLIDRAMRRDPALFMATLERWFADAIAKHFHGRDR